jgi:hypothetical protein
MGASLLGWWWGKKVFEPEVNNVLFHAAKNFQMMPWDLNSNVQITEASLHFLAAYHNSTIHFHRLKTIPKGRKFLLEISPDFMNRELEDGGDAVDGRWIDLSSGLYLNISAVRYSLDHPSGEGMLRTKSGQEFHVSEFVTDSPSTGPWRLMLNRTLCYIPYEIRVLKTCQPRFRLGIRKC